eukprot:CAMPEP_0175166798 /NCGR_PEP_ID=MMETSP0087-20121206/27928_1 /TAXON_ID=136419 /ORGANISM="Unknown Unknown, Strain D1" /LENGTH=349 /DNA_ID=CAMNT_0016456499 /DNA_START=27 /DNA_END=1076 /DNA_ORIENTATION=+
MKTGVGDDEEKVVPLGDDYSGMSLLQLRNTLSSRGLPNSGSQETLICLLRMSDQSSSSKKEVDKSKKRPRPSESSSSAERSIEFPENCIPFLECPVCMEVFEGEIYQCNSGHSICSVCMKKLQNNVCPTCRSSKVGRTRNLALEHLLQKVPLPCTNQKWGCNFQGDQRSRREHLEECAHKPLRCFFDWNPTCSWEGNREQFLAHIKSHFSVHSNRSEMFWTMPTFDSDNYCNFLSNTYCSQAESLITIYGVRETNSKFFYIDAYWVPLSDAALNKSSSKLQVVLQIPLKVGKLTLNLEPVFAAGGLNAIHKERIQQGLCVGVPSPRLAVTRGEDGKMKMSMFFSLNLLD